MDNIPRMRSLPQAIKEIQRHDSSTCYTLRALRRSVNNGEIPSFQVGSKRLVDLNTLLEILSNPKELQPPRDILGEIRRIN